MLARLHRAGELRAINVPDDTDEAMRISSAPAKTPSASGRKRNTDERPFCCGRGAAIRGVRGGHCRTAGGRPTSVSPVQPSTSRSRNTATRSARPSSQSTGSRSNCGSSRPLALGAGGRRVAGLTRGVVPHGGRARRRTRRPHALPASPGTQGVSRARAVGTFEWDQCAARRYHQDRQSPRAAIARRVGLGLSRDSPDWTVQQCQRPFEGSAVGLAPSDFDTEHHGIDALKHAMSSQLCAPRAGRAAPGVFDTMAVLMPRRRNDSSTMNACGSSRARSKIGFRKAAPRLESMTSSKDTCGSNSARSRSPRRRTENLAAPYSTGARAQQSLFVTGIAGPALRLRALTQTSPQD